MQIDYSSLLIMILATVASSMVVLVWRPSGILGTIATVFFLGMLFVPYYISLSYTIKIIVLTIEITFIVIALVMGLRRYVLFIRKKRYNEKERLTNLLNQ